MSMQRKAHKGYFIRDGTTETVITYRIKNKIYGY